MFGTAHLLLGFFVDIYFLQYVKNKPVFFIVVIIASLIPDLDTIFYSRKVLKNDSKTPSYKNFLHSYTFCLLLSIVLVLSYPIVALPFFIGYSFHLFFDSLSVEGIIPFWPFKLRSKGFIKPGSLSEKSVIAILIILNTLLIFKYLFF
ncbi:MAG: metal-dependent hydrolase [Candidatus Pacearchaeota archaeon]